MNEFDDALLHRAGTPTKYLRPLRDSLRRLYDLYKRRFVRMQ